MYKGLKLKPPIFEIGLKAYLYGEKAVELARAADRLSGKYDVQIMYTVQIVDIYRVTEATQRLLVLAPHLDPLAVGPGTGSVLAEAVKEAKAAGVLLNHAEKPLTLNAIEGAIRRADELGLVTLVCADSPEQAAGIAHLGPNAILAEPPELIGGDTSVSEGRRDFTARSVALVKKVNPEIIVFNSAGIRSGRDAAEVIRAGADATGSTSGILKAPDPVSMLEEMIRAVRMAWDETRG